MHDDSKNHEMDDERDEEDGTAAHGRMVPLSVLERNDGERTMAFDEKDVATTPTVNMVDSVEEIIVRRNRDLPGVQLDILVTRLVKIGDDVHRVTLRVPANIVDAAWPGASKTFKAHLLSIIDNAE
jgi:hypothetical protein